ncbi:MAG: glycosyltransferase family 4 protein [Bacteroidota bacterium]
MKKLAIITTHPIQYYAPVFKLLAKQVELKVFYSGGEQLVNQFDRGFKKQIIWDISLLDGYNYEFLTNTAKHPGSHHFKGIINPNGIGQINAFHPDRILIYGWSYHSHYKLIRHYKGRIPLFFRGDSTLLDSSSSVKSLLKTIFLKFLYKHIDAAFYVGQANKAYFKAYGLKENQLIFAPHAIDNSRFSENREIEALSIREKMNIPINDILILFAGKLEPKKNPQMLLNAFAELNLPHTHLLFVGNGILEQELKDITLDFNMTDKVYFLDFQNQTKMPGIYQSCDIFCLPSKGPGETWGLAINEAMASAKAILVSDKVGCAIDLVNSENGAIFNSNNIEDLKQKLIALSTKKTTLKMMGKNASNHIQDWSFDNQVTAIAHYVNR